MNKASIEIVSGDGELLPQLEALWLKLKDFHMDHFPIWSDSLRGGTFVDRVNSLKESSEGGAMLVELAKSETSIIAFCISVIDENGMGELSSLFVDESARQKGIGLRLVQSSLQWLKEHKASPIFVDVMAGNKAALKLYEKVGFVQRVHRLHWID